MPEINSRQAVKTAANSMLANHEAGRRRTVVIQTPAAFSAMAINDTLAGGQFIPKGSRLCGCRISNSTGTAASTVNIGLRKRVGGAVIDATAIASAIAITTATTLPTNGLNGTKVAGGVDYVTADDAEVYVTALGAVLAANQLLLIEVDYIGA